MPQAARLFLRNAFISGFSTAALLVLTLGIGNWIVGAVKLAQYRALALAAAPPTPDSAPLGGGFAFSDVSETQERHNIAVAKVHYYSVVVSAGQLLLATGLVLLLIGYRRSPGRLASQNKTLLDSR